MNTENSKTNESHRFRLSLADKLNLKNPRKNIALGNLSIYYTWQNIKSAYKNNKFKISAPTWDDTFDLPDGSYSIADIQDYFEFIIKKRETLTENPTVQINCDKIRNRIVFKIKTGYKLELLSSEKMKLLGSTKKDVDQDKDGEDVPKLESAEVVLVHCNVLNTNYRQTSNVLFTFVTNKQLGQLINIASHSLKMIGTTNTEVSFIEVWFTDQNSEPLGNKIADKITSLSKTKSKEKEKEEQETCIPSEKRQQIIDDLRLF